MDEATITSPASRRQGISPVAVLVHVVAIALGAFLGLRAMEAIAPDLPGESVEPGLSASAAPAAVVGNDPDSLFLPDNLAPALAQLSEQQAAGEGIVRLRIEPGSLKTESRTGEGLFEPEDVPATAPALIADRIRRERPAVTLEDIGWMELVATREGPRWYVQLDVSRTDVSPPWTYTAPLEGAPVAAGGAPPQAVAP